MAYPQVVRQPIRNNHRKPKFLHKLLKTYGYKKKELSLTLAYPMDIRQASEHPQMVPALITTS